MCLVSSRWQKVPPPGKCVHNNVAFCEKKSRTKPVLMLNIGEPAAIRQDKMTAGCMKTRPHCMAKYVGGGDINDRKCFQLYKTNNDTADTIDKHGCKIKIVFFVNVLFLLMSIC